MRLRLAVLSLIVAFPIGVSAQTGNSQVALAIYQGKPYDVAANCLMRAMSSREIMAWPLVYAPPRTEALVNLWPRGKDYGPPIGVFHVKQDETGATSISFEETQTGRLRDLAQAAAVRCGK